VSNKDKRRLNASVFQSSGHLANPKRAGVFRTVVAPAEAGMVIRAYLGYFRDFGLNKPPIDRVGSAHYDDSGATVTRAIEVNSIAPHIDQLA